jgi:type II secretory pathway pseudopilin PulG
MQTISRLKMNRQQNRSRYLLSLFKESWTVASRSPHYSSQGYTLIEMIAILALAGIIAGFAVPSLLSLNKPLRDGATQFKTQLSLMRSKAISSNQAYRLRPNPDPNPDGTREFIAEYAANCRVTAVGSPNGWERASQFDLDLPKNINLTDIASTTIADPSITPTAVSNSLGNGICFNNRGLVDTTAGNNTVRRLILKDFRGDNRGKIALIDVSVLGSTDIYTYDSNTSASPTRIPPDSNGNPVF